MTEDQAPGEAGEGCEFTGSGGGYCRLWLAHLLLVPLSLGLYSAWGRARRERYFLGQTTLAGSGFEYQAEPLRLLKGRLVAAALAAAVVLGGELGPLPWLAVALGALAGLLWLWPRSLAFHIGQASHLGVRLQCDPPGRGVLFACLGGVLLLVVPLAVAGLLLELTVPDRGDARMAAGYLLAMAGPVVALLLAVFLVRPYLQVQFANLAWNATRLGERRFTSRQALGSYWPLYAGNMLLILLTLGLYWPWARAREAAYRARHLRLEAAP